MTDRETRKCCELWIAVLGQAIKDLSAEDRTVKNKAMHWITSRENEETGSFVWVCNVFKIDPDKTWQQIRNLTEREKTKRDFWKEKSWIYQLIKKARRVSR